MATGKVFIGAITVYTRFKHSPAIGLGYEEGVVRRDPTDVIKVSDLCYVWYTRTAKGPAHVGLEKATDAVGIGSAGRDFASPGPGFPSNTWMIESDGPDHWDDTESGREGFSLTTGSYPWVGLPESEAAVAAVLGMIYDPTNGTVSSGQVYRCGGLKPSGQPQHYWFINGSQSK